MTTNRSHIVLYVVSWLVVGTGIATLAWAFWLQRQLHSFLLIPQFTGLVGILVALIGAANVRRFTKRAPAPTTMQRDNPMPPPSPPPSPTTEGGVGSWVLYVLSVMSIVATIPPGIYSIPIFTRNVEFGVAFFLVGEFALGILTLLLVVIPSWLLHRRRKDRRSQLSLRLSCLTLGILFLNSAAVMLFGH